MDTRRRLGVSNVALAVAARVQTSFYFKVCLTARADSASLSETSPSAEANTRDFLPPDETSDVCA